MELFDEFKHDPLDLSQHSIRVFDLLPLDVSGKIQCRLRHISLTDSTNIAAVSYECGSPESQKHQIWVNGKSYHVLDNLHVFLANLLKLHPDDGYRNLWIDAVCIDSHNLQERGHQVQQMKHIYKNAANVLIWLGPSNARSDRLFDFLNTLDNPESSENANQSVAQMTKEQWNMSQEKLLHAGVDIWRACASLSNRTYWTRLWIIQEILLARWPILVCGSKRAPWQSWAVSLDVLETFKDQTLTWTCWLHDSSANFICRQWFSTSDGVASDHLMKLVVRFRQSNCSDTRDHIFGLIGLASDASALQVNYDCSLDQLCRDVFFWLNDSSSISTEETFWLFRLLGLTLSDVADILALYADRSENLQRKSGFKRLTNVTEEVMVEAAGDKQVSLWKHNLAAVKLQWKVSSPYFVWQEDDLESKAKVELIRKCDCTLCLHTTSANRQSIQNFLNSSNFQRNDRKQFVQSEHSIGLALFYRMVDGKFRYMATGMVPEKARLVYLLFHDPDAPEYMEVRDVKVPLAQTLNVMVRRFRPIEPQLLSIVGSELLGPWA